MLGSTHGDALRYSTACFETFAFPDPEHLERGSELDSVGARLHEARAKYMTESGHRSTRVYDLLLDPVTHNAALERLRELHLELERVTLAAYGWSDIEVPAYTTPTSDVERSALDAYETAIRDRLLQLNAARLKRRSA